MRSTFGSSSASTEVKNRAVDGPRDGEGDKFGNQTEDDVGARMLQDFGEQFVLLMQPMWMAHASALAKASWIGGRFSSLLLWRKVVDIGILLRGVFTGVVVAMIDHSSHVGPHLIYLFSTLAKVDMDASIRKALRSPFAC
jgi:hypothetical protein